MDAYTKAESYHPRSLKGSVLGNSPITEAHYLDLTNFFDEDDMRLPEAVEPLVATGLGNEPEISQVQTTALEPNT